MRNELIVWACVAVALIAAETVAPGAFMLWLGFAAAGVFAVLLVVPSLTPIWQVVVFAGFSFLSVGMYWRFVRGRGHASDQPLLNRRAEQLVGQTYPLDTAIVDGRGRLKIGDAFWSVEGPDAPAGTPVRITSVHGMSLRVVVVD
jgi:membrane protein implicated in regulation of membrane protease activity